MAGSYELEEPEITLPVEAVDVILDWQEKAARYDELMAPVEWVRHHIPLIRREAS